MEEGLVWSKWWSDRDEPAYFIVTPKDIVVCRPRDSEDHVDWLLQRERFAEALAVWESGERLREAGAPADPHGSARA